MLLTPHDSRTLIAMRGGLVVAAVATMLGVSWPLLLAGVPGDLLLSVGAKVGWPPFRLVTAVWCSPPPC